MGEEFSLRRYYGALTEDTAGEIEAEIEARRKSRSESHRARVEEIAEALDG